MAGRVDAQADVPDAVNPRGHTQKRIDLRYFGHVPWIRKRFNARLSHLESRL